MAIHARPYFTALESKAKTQQTGCKRKRHIKSLSKQKMLYTIL
jgi:hypothetical protein